MEKGYLRRVLRGVSARRLFDVIDRIHEKTGKNRVVLFFDILGCALKYGAGYNDYNIFEFYYMTAKERRTYLTRIKNKKLISQVDDEQYRRFFNEKNLFDKKFAEFLGREVLDLAETDLERFRRFAEGKEYFFAKPYVGESGKGIEKLRVADFESVEALYTYVTDPDRHFGLVEEVIVQHPQAAKIYPYSLNCLRVVTLVVDNTPHILYAVFKMGNNRHFVDNLESGGLACHFDLDTGKIVGQGHTSALVNYDAHPETGIPFVGYSLPFTDEVKELVCKAAMVIPEFRYVGWDVCLTPNGPFIVEGNDYPAYDFPQLPDPDRPRIGLLAEIEALGIRI